MTLIALLSLVTAAVYGLALSPWDPFQEKGLAVGLVPLAGFDQTAIVAGVLGVAAVAQLAAGLGMLAMKPWAWRLTILLTGVGLAIWLSIDLTGRHASVRLALFAAIAFYLNTRAVRDAFLRRPDGDEAPS